MDQVMDDEDDKEQWFTIFQWRIDGPKPACEILSVFCQAKIPGKIV